MKQTQEVFRHITETKLKAHEEAISSLETAVKGLHNHLHSLHDRVIMLERRESLLSAQEEHIAAVLGIMQKNNAEMSLHLKRLDAVLNNIIRLGGLDEPKG